MGFKNLNYYLFLSTMVLLMPALGYSDENYISRATYYGSPDCFGTPTGACGFGEYGRTVNDGQVSGVSRLFRNGAGCGSCYQVRCNIPKLCSEDGTKVVVTDYGEGDKTDFILSTAAYARLACPNMAEKLFAYGVVDVEFKRVPCTHENNVVLKVHEYSRYPEYLAVVPLYQPGTYDIIAVEFSQENHNDWRLMRRAFGGVFDTSNPPSGPLNFRFTVVFYGPHGYFNLMQLNNALPSNWKPGNEISE